jgi:hypothetical protein
MSKVLAACAALLLTFAAPAAAQRKPPKVGVSSITLSPTNPQWGEPLTYTLKLTQPAPVGGTAIRVYWGEPWAPSAPLLAQRWITIPEGQTTGTLPMAWGVRHYQTEYYRVNADIPAGNGAGLRHAVRGKAPDGEYQLEFFGGPRVLFGGQEYDRVVRLNRPAPPEGLLVTGTIKTVIPGGSREVVDRVRVNTEEENLRYSYIHYPFATVFTVKLGTFSSASWEWGVVPHDRFDVGYGSTAGPAPNSRQMLVGIGSGPNPTGTTVALSVSDPRWHVPPQIHIPPGSPGAIFYLGKDADVPPGTYATLTATWNGQSKTIQIH